MTAESLARRVGFWWATFRRSQTAATRGRIARFCAPSLAWFFVFALGISSLFAADARVDVQDGNIVLFDAGGARKQLTNSGRDSSPVLAPDGKWVVFIRAVDSEKIETPTEPQDPAELWQVNVNGKNATRLARTRPSDKVEQLIAGFENIQFSADGRLVYFVTPAWVTSGAVHVVDTTNGKERFLLAGSNIEVLHTGEYRDHLLVAQHRYFLGGGSFDWWWLFKPDGTEVGPVGEETENFKELYTK